MSALAVTATNVGLPLLAAAAFRRSRLPDEVLARAMKLVERSLVIDMLAVIVIDFRPEAYARTLTAEEEAMFRTSGITGFHNSIGTGGPQVVEETLAFLAAWQGFVGRHSHLFTLVGKASDLDRAKAQGKIGVIMGLQIALPQAGGREGFTSSGSVARSHPIRRTSSAAAAPSASTAASPTA
jgi:membrane dipeptidase